MPNNRDESFVPLSLAPALVGRRADHRVAILTQSDKAQPFRPLGQPAAAPASAPHGGACEPSVTVQREGERISSIQVQCSCGQIIELACVYEPPAPAQT